MPTVVLLLWSILTGFLSPLVASQASVPSIVSYRRTVGPPVVFAPPEVPPSVTPKGRLIVVNWNVHVGHGDVAALIEKISSAERANGFGKPEFVLLLEESFRHGID